MCSEMTTNAAGMMIRIEAQSNTGKTGFGTVKNDAVLQRGEIQRARNPNVDDRRKHVAADHGHQHRQRGEEAAEHQRTEDPIARVNSEIAVATPLAPATSGPPLWTSLPG